MSDEIPPQAARAPRWLKEESEELIVLRGEMDYFFRNNEDETKQWYEVSERLNRVFRNGRSAEECKIKFLRLVRYYRDTGGKGPFSEQVAQLKWAHEDQEEEMLAGQPEEKPPQQVINCALRLLEMAYCLKGDQLEARSRVDPETQKLILVPVIAPGEVVPSGTRKIKSERRKQNQDVLVPTEAGACGSGIMKGSKKMGGKKKGRNHLKKKGRKPAEAAN